MRPADVPKSFDTYHCARIEECETDDVPDDDRVKRNG